MPVENQPENKSKTKSLHTAGSPHTDGSLHTFGNLSQSALRAVMLTLCGALLVWLAVSLFAADVRHGQTFTQRESASSVTYVIGESM